MHFIEHAKLGGSYYHFQETRCNVHFLAKNAIFGHKLAKMDHSQFLGNSPKFGSIKKMYEQILKSLNNICTVRQTKVRIDVNYRFCSPFWGTKNKFNM